MSGQTELLDAYDGRILLGLGLVALEFSRLEGAAKDLLSTFISPHEELGQIVVSNYPMEATMTALRTVMRSRLEPGVLSEAVGAWIDQVDKARQERNTYVHGRWLAQAVILERRVKKSELRTSISQVRPESLFDLAELAWELTQEGQHLAVDLAVAGFRDVTHIGEGRIERRASDPSLRLEDAPLLGRPAIKGSWPGRAATV